MLQQSNSRITINKLAEKFNVSRRTVFRDFNALAEMNIPVVWDEYKGYSVIEGYKIPPLMFSSRELATILVGLNFVKSQVDKTLVEDAEGVELKIKEVVPKELLSFMESLEERTVVDPYLNFGAEKMEGGSWYEISNAISQNKSIQFNYCSKSNGKISRREIDPYLLVFYRDHWNVIGYSHKRDAIRNFVLDRMSDIQITAKKFSYEGQIDVGQLIFRSENASYKIEVEVAETAIRRFRANIPTNIINVFKTKPKFFRVLFSFDNLDFINEWLLQFPNEVKIISPDVLIEKRKNLLNKMIEEL